MVARVGHCQVILSDATARIRTTTVIGLSPELHTFSKSLFLIFLCIFADPIPVCHQQRGLWTTG